MVYCKKCSAELRGDDVFCSKCGARVIKAVNAKKVCSHCHSELKEDDVFCPECGYRVESVVIPVMDKPKAKPAAKPKPNSVPKSAVKPALKLSASTEKLLNVDHEYNLFKTTIFSMMSGFFFLRLNQYDSMSFRDEIVFLIELGIVGYLVGRLCLWSAKKEAKKAAKETDPKHHKIREKNVENNIAWAYILTMLIPVAIALYISLE